MSRHPSSTLPLLILAYAGFVSLGLPDAVLGIAWPSLRAEFRLSQAAFGWLLFAWASGYVLSGLFAGRLLGAMGVGALLSGSTALVVVGVLGYALAPNVVAFAGASVIVGWGSGAIDAGLNAHAAKHFRPGHMAWLHAAYSAGAAAGSFTMALFVARVGGVHGGYAAIAVPLAALTLAFFANRDRWSDRKDALDHAALSGRVGPVSAFQALKTGQVQLGALAFFVYSGVELGAGHWAYSILLKSRGFSADRAGLVVSAYWTSIFLGRFAAGFVVERIGSVLLVRYGTIAAAGGAALFATSVLPDFVNAAGLAVVGIAIAPIYPGLMSETPRRTGAGVAHAVGFQVSAATAGMVLLPAAGGLLAERVGLEATAVFIAGCAVLLLVLHELIVRVGGSPHSSGAIDSGEGSNDPHRRRETKRVSAEPLDLDVGAHEPAVARVLEGTRPCRERRSTKRISSTPSVFGGGQGTTDDDGIWGWSADGVGEDPVRPIGVAVSPVDGALYVSSDNGAVFGEPMPPQQGVIYRIGIERD